MQKDKQLIFVTTSMFLIGVAYYWLFRNHILASDLLGIKLLSLKVPFKIDWLPSFIHQYVFIILTWYALNKKHKWLAIFIWLIINISFEILQALPLKYIYFLPKVLIDYSQYGTYSKLDMLAIFVATIFAYLTINHHDKKE